MAEGGKSKYLMITMKMDTISQEYEKTLLTLSNSIEDMAFTIDAPNQLAYITGKAHPQSLLKALAKANATASVCRIDYNYGQFFGTHKQFYPNIYPEDSGYNWHGSNSRNHGQILGTHDKQVYKNMYHDDGYGYDSYGLNSYNYGGTQNQFYPNMYHDDNREGYPRAVPHVEIQEVLEDHPKQEEPKELPTGKNKKKKSRFMRFMGFFLWGLK